MTQYQSIIGNNSVYVDPAVVTFVAIPAIAEIGSIVDSVTLRWEFSKTPLTMVFDGQSLPLHVTTVQREGPFSEEQSWVVGMGDPYKTAKARATLKFLNKVYWGNVDTAPETSDDILELWNSQFSTANNRRSIQFGSPSGKKPCLAYPFRFGPPRSIRIGVPAQRFPDTTDWSVFTSYDLATVSFTNPSGYTEDYLVLTFTAARDDSSLIVEFH